MSVFDDEEQAYLEALSCWVDLHGDPYLYGDRKSVV